MTDSMAGGEALLDLLEARSGIVCAVGAGGKKSLLGRLALAHPGRVAITATAFTTYFQEHLGFAVAIEEDPALPAAVARLDPSSSVAFACPSSTPGRRAGVRPSTIERIHRECGFVATYVKADGARMRLLKAPADDEPVLLDSATTVIPVVSARAIGEPLTDRVAHRVERVARVAQLRVGETIAPEHIGRLLASPDGLLKATAGRRVVPLINMVDDAAREAQAREAAEIALAMTDRYDRVVLASLRRAADPVIAVVERKVQGRDATGRESGMNDIEVRIPAALREYCAGAAELRAASGSVADVLREIGARHPQLLPRVLDADGQLRPFVNVFVGRANVRALEGLATPVPPGAVVSILPAVAGG